jgi:hypothetical protein
VTGDELARAFNLQTGEWELTPIVETFENEYVGDLIKIEVAGEFLETTFHHPFWVVEGVNLDDRPEPDHIKSAIEPDACIAGRWVDAGDLRVGDVLFLM